MEICTTSEYGQETTMSDYELMLQELDSLLTQKVSLVFWKYLPPIMIIGGTFGNILTIIVLLRRNMRELTTMFYLTVLAFSDIFVLYTGFLRLWIQYVFEFDVRDLSIVGCKIHTFLVYVSTDFTSWLMTAVTIDRYIAICHPFKSRYLCTIRRAKITLIIVMGVLILINHHFLWSFSLVEVDVGVKYCQHLSNYTFFYTSVWPYVDLMVFSGLPFIVMITCNAFIIRRLIISNTRRGLMVTTGTARAEAPSTAQGSGAGNKPQARQRNPPITSITAMLLAVSCVFMITTFPIVVYIIQIFDQQHVKDAIYYADQDMYWAVVNILQYLNNSIHIFLYSLSGPRFRRELKAVFKRGHAIDNVTENSMSLQANTNTVQ